MLRVVHISFFYPALLLCLSIQELVLLFPSSPIKSPSSLWTSKIGSLNGLNIKRKPRKRPSFPYYFQVYIYIFLEIYSNPTKPRKHTDNQQKDILCLVPQHKARHTQNTKKVNDIARSQVVSRNIKDMNCNQDLVICIVL